MPLSLSDRPGIHIYSYDGKTRDEKSYVMLCRIVNQELAVDIGEEQGLNVVFLDEVTIRLLIESNPDRAWGEKWYGACLDSTLIILDGDSDSHGSFIHEYIHVLHRRGLLFPNLDIGDAEEETSRAESLILGSRAYIEYLQTLLEEK
jgi:hypothetical protein